MTAYIRSFLALNFPVAVTRRIYDESKTLRPKVKAAGLEVTWVPAANLHLTLKFLGAIPEPSIEAIRDRLRRELAQTQRFPLEVRGLGAFPSNDQPRVIWAGVPSTLGLMTLQQNVEIWMEEIGFAREPRAFHAHVTLGRVKGGSGSIADLLGERADVSLGSGRMQEVVLYESRLQSAGAEYAALARIPFAGEPNQGK